MGTFSALLALCPGNSPVTGEFSAQRPVTRSFDVFFDLRLNKRLSKQSQGWWFETPSRSLWRHCNAQSVAAAATRSLSKPQEAVDMCGEMLQLDCLIALFFFLITTIIFEYWYHSINVCKCAFFLFIIQNIIGLNIQHSRSSMYNNTRDNILSPIISWDTCLKYCITGCWRHMLRIKCWE